MAKDSSVLSIGIFIIVLALSIVAFAAGLISLIEIVPLVLACFGVWIMVLAGINASKPQKYTRSAFSTFAWGTLVAAVGVMWLLASQIGILYSISALLLILGLLVVAAVLRTQRK